MSVLNQTVNLSNRGANSAAYGASCGLIIPILALLLLVFVLALLSPQTLAALTKTSTGFVIISGGLAAIGLTLSMTLGAVIGWGLNYLAKKYHRAVSLRSLQETIQKTNHENAETNVLTKNKLTYYGSQDTELELISLDSELTEKETAGINFFKFQETIANNNLNNLQTTKFYSA